MKWSLFVISLMLAVTYGPLLAAQSNNTTSESVAGLEAKDAKSKDAKALQQEADSSVAKQQPAILTKQKDPKTDSNSNNQELNKNKAPSKQKALSENEELSEKKGPSKVFIPTEEISEDKPVAFPVDI
ncbi:MAG: hypothetical protein ACI8XV_001694 [Arenicella sp.]|jgi:hypothetical protein